MTEPMVPITGQATARSAIQSKVSELLELATRHGYRTDELIRMISGHR